MSPVTTQSMLEDAKKYYGELVDARDIPVEAKKPCAAIVKPYAGKKARFKAIPTVDDIDWSALGKDENKVATLRFLACEAIVMNELDDAEALTALVH